MPDRPSDAEFLDVIVPILVQAKLEGVGLTDAGERAVTEVRKAWPKMGLKRVKAAVTRLRIL